MPGITWPAEQVEYFTKRIKKDKIHPADVYEEMKKAFPKKFNRSYSAFKSKVKELGIKYGHLIPKELRTKRLIQTAASRVKQDTEKLKSQQKYRSLETKYKILAKEKTLSDTVIQVLSHELKALPKVDLIWKTPELKTTKEVAGLLLGDTHIGEIVDRDEVMGLGEYNFDIFVKRLKFLATSMKSIAVKKLRGYQINKLIIFMLGDMISGMIHDELRENAEDIVFQVLNGAYVTAQFVLEMLRLFNEVEIEGVLGNHGRLTQKKHYKKRYTNWDFVFYQMLGMFLAGNDRVKCSFPKSPYLIRKIYDWGFLVMHGDNIKSWMGIPWYGIQRALWKLGDLLQGQGHKIHYRVLGHFHNTGELDRAPGEFLINGSIIGGSEYSLNAIFEFDRPTQIFFGVHKEIGITWRYHLRLDLPEVDTVIPYKYNRDLDASRYMKDLLKK